MAELPLSDGMFDLVRAEGSAYIIGAAECRAFRESAGSPLRTAGEATMGQALAGSREELAMHREHGGEYGCAAYALRPMHGAGFPAGAQF
ncbi:hypothetical protein OG760_31435 [Streptomyces sp. NBC_00963]|uniref:hypothetical protein n=1 Tax=Streptomyces sp. NBC_00963 TaxID=2903697 RepID=UPI003866283A|nr:hypothetical protein OG760_31435 [Streptomyces sp. NBC_00963]